MTAPPGEFRIYGRLLRTITQTIDFSGSVFECWLDDSHFRGRSAQFQPRF